MHFYEHQHMAGAEQKQRNIQKVWIKMKIVHFKWSEFLSPIGYLDGINFALNLITEIPQEN